MDERFSTSVLITMPKLPTSSTKSGNVIVVNLWIIAMNAYLPLSLSCALFVTELFFVVTKLFASKTNLPTILETSSATLRFLVLWSYWL
jgi:hypothetical protein